MSSRLPPLHPLMLAVGLLAIALQATAQTAPQRVEVTGSSIKRLDGETALPVQVIKREDIERTGVTTAAELLKTLSANTAPLSDGASITDGTSGQRGFNGAHLRGIGVSSTLVLLNGRRLANFATPGDSAGVDLNNIPAGAIQRVEVLKDGASAVYGSDAIGGVINFITRKDYQGLDLGAFVSRTQEGGAGKVTATVSGGYGDVQRDGFNLFGSLDLQRLDSLRSSQRQFIQDRPLATTLPALMSSNTFPANIDISSAQRNALIAAGALPAGSTRTRINSANPTCNTLNSATVNAPAGPGGPLACSYDYMQDTEIYPESKRIGFVGRGTFQLSRDHQLFAEAVLANAQSTYVLSPNPQRFRNLPVSVLPDKYRVPLVAAGFAPTSTFSGIRYRMTEAGNRSNEVSSDATRVVVGAQGTLGSWDYETALSRAENKVADRYVNGYSLFDRYDAGIRAGTINPFGPSSQTGKDLINSLRVNDAARKSTGTTEAVDVKGSTVLSRLDGGELALAVGAELRREKQSFRPSALLLSNNILGDRGTTGVASLTPTDNERKVSSAYAEINAPFSKELEGQFALRTDRYSDAGGTTNPKVGLRWQPSKQVLVRTSANTGFRAPSLSDLYRPDIFGSASSFLTDPQCVRTNLDTIDGCTDQWAVTRKSNPKLKPEKSRQFSLGAVFEPVADLSLSIDYWNINVKDVISTLGEQIIVDSPDKYNGSYITRDVDGFISNILLQKENQGKLKTSGIDLSVDWKGITTSAGRFSAGINATVVLKYDRQFGPQEPFRSNLGVFLNDQVIQKWRHRLSFGWDLGPVALTLSNQYSAGYTDQNTTYDPVANQLLPTRKVAAYSLWDLTGSWAVDKNLKLRAGVLNLADAAPPFSNQAYYFLAGYDPTYTDPRGRTWQVSASYTFK